MEDKLQEWKEQWNNGDVKFVPELFELAEELDEIIQNIEAYLKVMEKSPNYWVMKDMVRAALKKF